MFCDGVPEHVSYTVDLVTIHRPDFLRILLESGPKTYRTHFQKRLLSYHDSGAGPITLNFKDGTVATCDVLVGADGIKSAVRANMYEKLASQLESANSYCTNDRSEAMRRNTHPTWTGQVVYRSLIPREALENAYPNHHSLSVPTLVSITGYIYVDLDLNSLACLTVCGEEQVHYHIPHFWW